jgi:hypothetical protein
MRVRLIKKLAEKIDGVDLTGRSVGDLLNLESRDARLLIAEQWAVPGGDNTSDLTRSQASESDRRRNDPRSGTTAPRERG